MAFNRAPSPALIAQGVLRSLEVYKTGEKSAHGAGHDAGRAQILTNDGGFLDVYVDPTHVPDVRQLGPNSDVTWLVEVDVFTQTSAKGTRWSSLSARLIRDMDALEPSEKDSLRTLADTLGAADSSPKPHAHAS